MLPARLRRPALRRLVVTSSAVLAALGLAVACTEDQTPTGPPELKVGVTALTVTPGSLSFTIPPLTPATITVRVQFVGLITAATSDAGCATVAPASVPATKPPGSSVYVATFTVTPVAVGSCTITVTDKKGEQVRMPVKVEPRPDHIAFQSGRDPGGIFLMNADGTGVMYVASGVSPALSPDGKKIAFVSLLPDQNSEIYIVDAEGTNLVRLTDDPGLDDDPSFSPDGSKILFDSDRDGHKDIYVMDADGNNVTRLTNNPGYDYNIFPAFSPDGTQIAFESVRDGNPEIYIMNADGTGQARLTNDPGEDLRPTFSPDGKTIAFDSNRDGHAEIYLMNVDGTNPVRLTTSLAADYDPTFSPDGTKIAFVSYRDGNNEIYVMGADGSNPVNLTSNSASDYAPSFGH